MSHLPRLIYVSQVQLIETQRSNNVAIALTRIRMSNDAIRAAILDPAAHPLAAEKVNALRAIVPTAEEVHVVVCVVQISSQSRRAVGSRISVVDLLHGSPIIINIH